jgi:predicted DNA-binding transcriptional regulator AlpA
VEADERYLSINAACEAFGFSRSTFYRMHDDPQSGLSEVVVRIPPGTGRIKVPRAAFEEWLKQKHRRRGARSQGGPS